MRQKKITRRDFLKVAGITGAGLAAAACAPIAAPAPAPTSAPAVPTTVPAATTAPTAPAVVSKNPVTVSIWGWWEERMKLFESAAKGFMEQNPNVTVKIETLDSKTFWEKLFASVPAGTGPTLSKMQTTNYFKLRDQGLLIELPKDVFPDEFIKSTYPEFPLAEYGRFVIPEGVQPAVFTYNKKLFTEAGLDPAKPPRTWDEFYAAGEKLTKRDSSGTIKQAGVQFDDWLPLVNPLLQLGGSLVKRDGGKVTANFKSAEMEKAFQFFIDAAQKYKIWDPAFPYYSDAIGNQQAAMSIGESWVYGTWKTDFPDVFKDLAYAAPPTPTGEAKPYYGRKNNVLSLAMMTNRPADETEAGLRFLEYFAKQRADTQSAVARISGLVPSNSEAAKSKEVTEDPFLALSAQLAAKEYDIVDVPSALNKIVNDSLNKVLLEKQTVEQAMDYGQAQLQSALDQGDIKYLF